MNFRQEKIRVFVLFVFDHASGGNFAPQELTISTITHNPLPSLVSWGYEPRYVVDWPL